MMDRVRFLAIILMAVGFACEALGGDLGPGERTYLDESWEILKEEGGTTVFRTVLPDVAYQSPALMMKHFTGNFEVRLDDTLIYRYGHIAANQGPIWFSHGHFIPLPRGAAGKVMTIRAYLPKQSTGFKESPIYGESVTLTRLLMRDEALAEVACLLVLVIGIGALAAYVWRRDQRELVFLAIYALGTAVFGLAASLAPFHVLAIDDQSKNSILRWTAMAWCLAGAGGAGLVEHLFKRGPLAIMRWWRYWFSGMAVIAGVAALFDFGPVLHQPFFQDVRIHAVVFAVCMVGVLSRHLLHTRGDKGPLIPFLVGLFAVNVASGYDMWMEAFEQPFARVFEVGNLGFVLALVYVCVTFGRRSNAAANLATLNFSLADTLAQVAERLSAQTDAADGPLAALMSHDEIVAWDPKCATAIRKMVLAAASGANESASIELRASRRGETILVASRGLTGHIDLDAIGAIGRSVGGAVTLQANILEIRIPAKRAA